jgi:hypothetical protein
MNFSKTVLLVALLLCAAVLAGCQEQHSRVGGVVLEPSATGFWHAKVTSSAFK